MSQSILSEYDNVTAAGILARAALSLEDSNNPDAATRLPNERMIRAQLLEEIRRNLGIRHTIESRSDVEMIVDALDSESEKLFAPINQAAVLDNLSKKGELPADLYEVSVDEGIDDFFGKKAENEKKLIASTVKHGDEQQHFTQKHSEHGEIPLISLYCKHFENKYPARNFTLLVTGLRNGTLMSVSNAWRLYDDVFAKTKAAPTLLDLLETFANEYGMNVSTGGETDKLILQCQIRGKIEDNVNVELENPSGRSKEFKFVISHFISQAKNGQKWGSLVYAIDLNKYKRALLSHGWEGEQLVDFTTAIETRPKIT